MQRRDQDFELAATIDIKELMRSTPDLRSARLQVRLDWENAHWNTLVSSANLLTVPGVKQDPDGLDRGCEKSGTAPAKPPPPRITDPEGRWSVATNRRPGHSSERPIG